MASTDQVDVLSPDVRRQLEESYEPLVKFLYHRTWNTDLAQDLAQDTYLRAIQKIELFDPEKGPLLPWLRRIAYRLFVDRCRSKSSDIVASGKEELLHGATDSDEGPLAALLRNETAAQVKRAFQAIPERYQEVLLMVDIEGQTHKEVAELLDEPIGTISSRRHLGKQKLREALDALYK